MPGNQPIQSIQRAIAILYALAGAEDGRSIREIASITGLGLPNVYRMIQTLEKEHVVYRRSHPLRFLLGPVVQELQYLDQSRTFFTRSSAALKKAHDRLCLDANLFLVEYLGCHFHVRQRCQAGRVSHVQWLRGQVNLQPYQKPTALILLAFGSPAVIADFHATYPFDAEAERIWGSRTSLDEQLMKIRREGFATLNLGDGLLRAAAPVWDSASRLELIAAVGGNVAKQNSGVHSKHLVAAVADAASAITRSLDEIRFAQAKPT